MSESLNSESLPPQEVIGRQGQWRSAYSPVAIETLGKVMRDKARRFHPKKTEDEIRGEILLKQEKLKVWLDAIDAEVVRNFGVFESQKDPGVRFPYTKVRVRNVASEVQNERFYKAGVRSLGMGIKHLHWMDPGRWPDKWLRGIESYENAVGAQMQAY